MYSFIKYKKFSLKNPFVVFLYNSYAYHIVGYTRKQIIQITSFGHFWFKINLYISRDYSSQFNICIMFGW